MRHIDFTSLQGFNQFEQCRQLSRAKSAGTEVMKQDCFKGYSSAFLPISLLSEV
jgi:hypothetical protein